jgi:hypothetical protein
MTTTITPSSLALAPAACAIGAKASWQDVSTAALHHGTTDQAHTGT